MQCPNCGEEISMRRFRFHWKTGGKASEGLGLDMADAFTKLGYGAGAMPAVDWYEEVSDSPETE